MRFEEYIRQINEGSQELDIGGGIRISYSFGDEKDAALPMNIAYTDPKEIQREIESSLRGLIRGVEKDIEKIMALATSGKFTVKGGTVQEAKKQLMKLANDMEKELKKVKK